MSAPWVEELRSRPWITPRRWSEISGEARSSVYDQLARGHLPALKLGERSMVIPTIPLLKMLGVDAEDDESRRFHAGPSHILTTPSQEIASDGT